MAPEHAMGGNQDGERFANQCLSTREPERRTHPRYSIDEECLLLLVNHGMPIKGRVIDLSVEGCRVRTSEPFPAKAGRTVEVSFKVKGFAFRFCGVVRWGDGHQIAGIHFENMIPRRKVELIEVIEEMAESAARGQAASRQAAEQPAPPPASPQPEIIATIPAGPATAKSTQPLIAAKPAVHPAAEKAIEPPAQIPAAADQPAKIEPQPPRPNKARDRRGQARHEIDSTATIFLVKVASALRGRIIDLSLGGCRIRTDEKFPVGIYTRVEIEFHLQGLPFRLGGVIQAIHNRNTVGIRLLDLSERKRQQVLDLIDEIEEIRAETEQEDSPLQDQGLAGSR